LRNENVAQLGAAFTKKVACLVKHMQFIKTQGIEKELALVQHTGCSKVKVYDNRKLWWSVLL